MLTIHSSDISVDVGTAATDSPRSARPARQHRVPSPTPTPPSDSYTAALETIEQLCDTADEAESFIAADEQTPTHVSSPSSAAEQSFKTALTSLGTSSSARLAISREYDASDELASFGSSSDSAWETEDSSATASASGRSSRRRRIKHRRAASETARTKGTFSSAWTLLLALVHLLAQSPSSSTPGSTSAKPSALSWRRLLVNSMLTLALSCLLGKILLPASAPFEHALTPEEDFVAAFDKAFSVDKLRSTPLRAPASTAQIVTAPIAPALFSMAPAIAPQVVKIDLPPPASAASQASVSVFSLRSYITGSAFSFAITILTLFIFKTALPKITTSLFKPKPIPSGLQYVPGRKIVIRPARRQTIETADETRVKTEPEVLVKQEERGASVERPIDLTKEENADDMMSSTSSIVTVVPTAPSETRNREDAKPQVQSQSTRAVSTPIRPRRKDIAALDTATASIASPPGSDRVLRSYTKAARAKSTEPEFLTADAPDSAVAAKKGKGRQVLQEAATESKRSPRLANRAKTVPAPSPVAPQTESRSARAASVPARDRRHESFHVCLLHGSDGVGKASLLQRAKRGTYFDPNNPKYPGPESLQEFKDFNDVKHLHFEKGDWLTTLVFGYGTLYDKPKSAEAKRWMDLNKVYTMPNVAKSKFDKRGDNVHLVLYDCADKVSNDRRRATSTTKLIRLFH